MISWGTILYGAALSGAAAAVALVLLAGRQRSLAIIVAGVVGTVASPIGWNAILRVTHASNFFTDAPLAVFPASWQDFGSGAFTVAGSAILLGLGPMRSTSAARLVKVSALCGLTAFLVDIYLY